MAPKQKRIQSINPPLEWVHSVGKGAMGEVNLYHDPFLDRTVVVKQMNSDMLDSPEMIKRFEREVQVLSCLKHPNIVDIYGFWMAETKLYLSMEFINGWTLRQLLEAEKRPPHWVCMAILWDMLTGLEYAHATYAHKDIGPIAHRDIKPANIMIGFNGRLRLLDFGISKPQQSKDLTNPGTQIGTIAYMSPEQIQEAAAISTKTDIFSAGIIFWELLTGKHPFRGPNAMSTCQAIVNKDLDWKLLPYELDPKIKYLLQGMLQKDPKKRFSAQQALETLEQPMQSLPRNPNALVGHYLLHIRKPESVLPPSPPNLPKFRKPISTWLFTASGCLVCLAAGMLIGHLA
jgi:serine/threonine-protein kinase